RPAQRGGPGRGGPEAAQRGGADEAVRLAGVPVGRQRDGGGGGDVADVDGGDPGRAERRRVQARAGQRGLQRGVVLEEVPGPQDGERDVERLEGRLDRVLPDEVGHVREPL